MDPRIDAIQREAAARDGVIPLGGGLPSEQQFPRRALAAAFVEVLRPGSAALQYSWPEGSQELRERVAARLRARGATVSAQDVLITHGAQQAIDLALQLCTRRGSAIGVDAQTYPAALDLFRARRRVAVAALPRGLLPVQGRPGASPERGASGRPGHTRPSTSLGVSGRGASEKDSQPPGAFYVLPAVGNPVGRGLPPQTREALLRSGAALIEDDAYADLRFDGPAGRPLLADAPERVWHVGTLSKTLCPGLRLGWLVPPADQRARALRLKQDSDLQSAGLTQAVAEHYLAAHDFDARLVRLRRHYAARAERLLKSVRRHLPEARCEPPQGGFALWLELDESLDELALLKAALRRGVIFDPGSLFRPDRATAPSALRLCFSYARTEALAEGAKRLGAALKDVRVARSRRLA